MSKKVNNICEILDIKYPVLQGAMAWISLSSLVIAVSEAGGLGILAGGNAPKDVIKEEIRKIKEKTDKPFGVNLMMVSPFIDDIVDLICEEGVKVVTTGAGSPAKYMERFKEAGVKVIPVVSTVGMAKKMEQAGATAVIAEGGESGGHIGSISTMSLVPQVVDALNIPVIAAGGIADGRGLAASLMLGACGVQMGTVFLAAKECEIHEDYKQAVVNAKEVDTTVTGSLTGLPVRVLKNNLTKELMSMEQSSRSIGDMQKVAAGKLRAAVVDGDIENGSVMCGQIAGMIHEIKPVKQIVDEIISGFEATINQKHCFWCN